MFLCSPTSPSLRADLWRYFISGMLETLSKNTRPQNRPVRSLILHVRHCHTVAICVGWLWHGLMNTRPTDELIPARMALPCPRPSLRLPVSVCPLLTSGKRSPNVAAPQTADRLQALCDCDRETEREDHVEPCHQPSVIRATDSLKLTTVGSDRFLPLYSPATIRVKLLNFLYSLSCLYFTKLFFPLLPPAFHSLQRSPSKPR